MMPHPKSSPAPTSALDGGEVPYAAGEDGVPGGHAGGADPSAAALCGHVTAGGARRGGDHLWDDDPWPGDRPRAVCGAHAGPAHGRHERPPQVREASGGGEFLCAGAAAAAGAGAPASPRAEPRAAGQERQGRGVLGAAAGQHQGGRLRGAGEAVADTAALPAGGHQLAALPAAL
eukprot:1195372-Prorocentrum_minimum.AAC.6